MRTRSVDREPAGAREGVEEEHGVIADARKGESAVRTEAARVRGVPRWVLAVWVLAVNWQVVRWYAARLGDGGDEPWGLVALAAALVLTPRAWWRARMSNTAVAGAGLLAVAAVVTAGVLPVLVRGGLVAGALGVAIGGAGARRFLGEGAAGRLGLLLLSLPVVATAQFYAGYPLRVITAELGRPLLWLAGVATERSGVVLSWAGGEVIVDAPCSGVRMLWAGLALACGLAAWRRTGMGRTVAVVTVAAVGVIAANALRAAVLFLTESGVWPNAAWVHEAVGAAVFGGVMAGLWKIVEGGAVRGAGSGETERVNVWERTVASRAVTFAGVGLGIFLAAWSTVWAWEKEARRVDAEEAVRAGADALGGGVSAAFPGWPEVFEGRPLQPVARSEQARVFAQGFPGETAVFVQAGRVVVLRWIREATRGVHPAADCYRARGYRVETGGLVKDAAGGRWSEFTAERGGECWRVRERWRDERGQVWTDVSAWWWAAQGEEARGPWWAETVVVREATQGVASLK